MAQSSIPTAPGLLLERVDNFARHEPTKAVATAFGFGLILHLLPLGSIASVFVSLLFPLARPALLLLGVLKVFDLARGASPAATPAKPVANGRRSPQ